MTKNFKWKLLSPFSIGIIILSGMALIAVIVATSIGFLHDSDENESQIESTVEKDPNSISIPGYEMLELKANTREQTLCMPNPPQNCCYFQLTLYLSDGTLIWQSELIEPGSNSKPMVLLHSLSKGMYYNAILKYSCYSMDGTLTPLNGAETKLTLKVK